MDPLSEHFMYSLLPEVDVRGSSKGTIPKDKTCKDADSRKACNRWISSVV